MSGDSTQERGQGEKEHPHPQRAQPADPVAERPGDELAERQADHRDREVSWAVASLVPSERARSGSAGR